jgi:hypothetical protein
MLTESYKQVVFLIGSALVLLENILPFIFHLYTPCNQAYINTFLILYLVVASEGLSAHHGREDFRAPSKAIPVR